MRDILQEIEQARTDMYEASDNYGLTSEECIAASERLDELINRYEAEKCS